jgi:hypothetical protein
MALYLFLGRLPLFFFFLTLSCGLTLDPPHADGPGRTRMVVRRSEDGGKSWPHTLEVYKGGAAYSCLSPMPSDDFVGLMFERDGAQCTQGASCYIAFAVLPAKW